MDLVDPILSLCLGIHQMAGNAKANKKRCQRVAERMRELEELVLTIKQRGPGQISAVVENALRELCNTLAFAKGVLIKYSQTKNFKNFLKSSSHKDKFRELNERLSENLQVLSGAMQIEQVNMLHKVIEALSGRSPNGVDSNGCSGIMHPTAPMPLPGTMAPMPFSSAMALRPVLHFMAPSNGAPVPLTTLITQLTFPPQNNSVLGNDVINNSFNS